MSFKKPYLPNYFDESVMKPEDKALLQQEKALQKTLTNSNMYAYHVILEDCVKGWRKYLNTQKMREGCGMSERSYQLAVSNLARIRG